MRDRTRRGVTRAVVHKWHDEIDRQITPGPLGAASAALVAKYGRSKVWQASFRGHRRGDGFSPLEWTFVQPCFATQKTCVARLYWEQSDWPEHDAPGRCRQGAPDSGF